MNNLIITALTSVIMVVVLSACSGGGGAGPSVSSFELIDPTFAAGNKFGTKVAILPNGNIVVSAPTDSTYALNSGAVHLYNPYTQSLIASFYGDTANDQLGNGGITTLANNNFVITSAFDDEAVVDGGTVRLIDGTTGVQINMLAGDTAYDYLGMNGITALANNNFVIASQFDDETVVDGGTVRLVNGSTGIEINMLAGDATNDYLGYGLNGITALSNNNFVITSQVDDETVVDGGTVRLVNGNTGIQINMLAGDVANDQLGSAGITALANNNFVIASSIDDEAAVVDGGTVRLVNGTTGVQINMFAGDTANDQLGNYYLGNFGVTALANNNFVITSHLEDEAAIVDGGTVRLVDGTTGVQINMLAGDTTSDQLGSNGIITLDNNNFAIVSDLDDETVIDGGTVRLVNGATGAQINMLAGDTAYERLGNGPNTALANNNFVIASIFDDEAAVDGGTVRLFNGTTGVQINMLAGDTTSDNLGNHSITALANNNFVIVSSADDETVVDGGTVRLVDGNSGIQINMLAGDTTSDKLGITGITALSNNNFVIASRFDDEAGIVDAGSVREMNGTTGNPVRSLIGSVTGDMVSIQVVDSPRNDFYIVSLADKDNNSLVDSGFVTLIARPIVN